MYNVTIFRVAIGSNTTKRNIRSVSRFGHCTIHYIDSSTAQCKILRVTIDWDTVCQVILEVTVDSDTAMRYIRKNKNVDIKFCAHDVFLEKPSSGMFKAKIFES